LKRQSVKGLLSAVLKESHSDTGTGTGKGTGARKVAAAGSIAGTERERKAESVAARRSETKQDPVSLGVTAATVACQLEGSTISAHYSSSCGSGSSSTRGRRNEVRRTRTEKEVEIDEEVEEYEGGEKDQGEWSDGNSSEYVEEEDRADDEQGKHNCKKMPDNYSSESADEGESESSGEEGNGCKKKKYTKKSKCRDKRKISQVDADTALRPCSSKRVRASLSLPAVVTPEVLLDLVLPRGMRYVLAPTSKAYVDGAEEEKGVILLRGDIEQEEEEKGMMLGDIERDDPVLQQLRSVMGGYLLDIHTV
jgi:hypothetical protein